MLRLACVLLFVFGSPPNLPPIPTDDVYAGDWSTTLVVPAAAGVLANDTDPDGDPLSAHLRQPPEHGTLALNRDGGFTYQPDYGFSGQVAFVYKAWDGTEGREATVTIEIEPGNLAPVAEDVAFTVILGERLTIKGPGVKNNDHDPEGAPLTAYLLTTPVVGHLGFHEDGGFWFEDLGQLPHGETTSFTYAATRQNFYLQVQHNTIGAPSFASTPPTEGFVGVPYHYDAEVAAKGVSLKFELIEGPEGLTLDPSRGIIQWTPEPTQLGNHALGLRVSDYQGGTDTQHWTIQVGDPGDITPPEVFVNLDQNRVDPNQVVTIAVAASDDQGVSDIAASINGTPIALDASRQATFSSPEPGIYHVRATATDSAGNSADHGQDIWVSAPEDLEPPVVTIHTPTRDTTLTSPQDVWITAQDPNLAQWTLEVGKTGRDCWTPIASGQAEVSNAPVGVFDTSLLPNGLYTLRLTAYDVNGSNHLDPGRSEPRTDPRPTHGANRALDIHGQGQARNSHGFRAANHRILLRQLMDRLIHVDYPNDQWITYDYDAAGNRTEITTAEGTTSFTFDALNRLPAMGGAARRNDHDKVNVPPAAS